MRTALILRLVVVVMLALCVPAGAWGQAWLPFAGEGTVTLTYQGLFSPEHLDAHGHPLDKGQVASHTLLTGLEYGLNDFVVLDMKLAFVANKHEGADQLHGPLDTGIYHGTVQDARVALSFRVPTRGAVAIAPYVGGIIPTHEYETRGHSAPGRRLRALQLGAWIGRDLGPVLPKAYLQGRYGFALVERIGDMSVNRSAMDLEGGYAVSNRVTATLAFAAQRTHGGLNVPLPRDEHYHEVVGFHDRVTRDNYVLVSAGATFVLSSSLSVFGSLVKTVWGQNTHRINGVVVGASWAFGGGLDLGGPAAPSTTTAVHGP